MINSLDYAVNEAWIVFYLNEEPIQTELDGDFNAIAIMDVNTRLIHGFKMEPLKEGMSDFEAQQLFRDAIQQAHGMPELIFLTRNLVSHSVLKAAKSKGVKLKSMDYDEIYPVIADAVTGFSQHIQSRRK